MPGEEKIRARPLKPAGAKFATTDPNVAVEVAKILYQTAVFNNSKSTECIDLPENDSLGTIAKAYLDHCDEYYRDSTGKVTSEPQNIRYSLKPLVEMYGTLPADEFGPLKLIEVQKKMISLNWSRGLINQRIGRIKRMFKWAVSRQIVSPMIYQGLLTVEGLKLGRSAARETKPVKPVDIAHVYAIFPFTTNVVANMIELLLLTGMRPGELVIMRPCDIDRTGEIWHYKPRTHKTLHKGKERMISIGPKAQDILRPYLLRNPQSCCFSPSESEKQRRAALTEKRVTPLSCGNTVGSSLKKEPKMVIGEAYDTKSFGKSVRYAISAARKAVKKSGKDPDTELPKWTLYQLRHTAATKVRKEFGYESAGAALGHTNMNATAIYAERNQGLADEAARRLG